MANTIVPAKNTEHKYVLIFDHSGEVQIDAFEEAM